MIRVRAPSRLHFGLLNCGAADGGRLFGGAGLMLELPGLRLAARAAAEWSAEGPLAERALAVARQFAESLPPGTLGPQHVVVEQSPPEHVGLGTGTQLALAVGRALAEAAGLKLDVVELARRLGRGTRSAVGVHGFAQGGFLVDGGKRAADGVAPLVARLEFPPAWRVALVLPRHGPARHGVEEREAFRQLQAQKPNRGATERLCRVLLLGVLPALAERDPEAFGEALHEYNARAGELFAGVQGGTYADGRVAELVAFLRQQGVRGCGQSSWGPAVFAVVPDADRAGWAAERLRGRFGLAPQEVLAAAACNRGAVTVSEPRP